MHNLSDRWQQLRSHHHLRYGINIISFILPVGFILLLLSKNTDDLRQLTNWQSYLGTLGIGVLLYPLSFITQAIIWQKMMSKLSQMRGGWYDLEVYARTHLIRRIPGVVWYLAGRTLMYRNKGISAEITLTASGLEWGLLIIASLITFVATSLSSSWWIVLLWLVGLCIGSAWVLSYLISHLNQIPMPGWFRSKFSNLAPNIHISPADIASWLALFLWAYFVGGGILYVLIHGVVNGLPVNILEAWRAWSLSGGVGLLFSAVIPAGMGVRELTTAGLLAPDVPVSISLIVSILLRIVFILGDLIWGGLLWAIAWIAVRARDHEQPETRNQD